jgi:hypothetical protein
VQLVRTRMVVQGLDLQQLTLNSEKLTPAPRAGFHHCCPQHGDLTSPSSNTPLGTSRDIAFTASIHVLRRDINNALACLAAYPWACRSAPKTRPRRSVGRGLRLKGREIYGTVGGHHGHESHGSWHDAADRCSWRSWCDRGRFSMWV